MRIVSYGASCIASKYILCAIFLAVIAACSGGSNKASLNANAGDDLTLVAGEEVTLVGEASGSGERAYQYQWHQPSNQSLPLEETDKASLELELTEEHAGQSFTLFFTVTDATGNSDTDTLVISVKAASKPLPFIIDLSTQRLLLPVNIEGTHDIQLDLSTAPQVNNITLLALDGINNQIVELKDAAAGDFFTITIERPNTDGSTVQEDWELWLTGLPIIHIETQTDIVDEPKIPAYLTLLEPYSNGETQVFTSYIGVEYRGNTSQFYAKKSLGVELWEEQAASPEDAEERKERLLGMRNDDDWILDAMYIDYGRMRNRVSTDLWRDIARTPQWSEADDVITGTQGEFVEIVLNNHYHGLYMLTEKIDRKQLELEKTDDDEVKGILYKADYWGDVDGKSASKFEATIEPPIADEPLWYGWELEYPKDPSAEAWLPLANLYSFVRETSDADFKAGIESHIDLDNIVDYALLLNVILGKDNQGKNTFFAIADSTSSAAKDNRLYYLPWDMDGTWGRLWNSSKDTHIGWLDNYLLERIYTTNPSDYRQRLKDRWQTLREGALSPEALASRFTTYTQRLNESGAINRENDRWGEQLFMDKGADLDLTLENVFLSGWINDRISWLDEYINDNY